MRKCEKGFVCSLLLPTCGATPRTLSGSPWPFRLKPKLISRQPCRPAAPGLATSMRAHGCESPFSPRQLLSWGAFVFDVSVFGGFCLPLLPAAWLQVLVVVSWSSGVCLLEFKLEGLEKVSRQGLTWKQCLQTRRWKVITTAG